MIYPNPRHLRAFVTLVECRSFSAAAGQLHMGQPALSQAIAKLEDIVGVRLLERTTRSVALTPAGEEFLTDAHRVLRENERLVTHGAEWATASRGHLTLLTVPSIAHRLLPEIVRLYQERYPNIQINIHDHPDPVLRERMHQGDGDLAILTQSEVSKGSPFLPILKDEFLVLLPKQHPLAELKTIPASRLASEQWVVQRPGALLRDYIEPLLAKVQPAKALLEVSQTGTVTGMVEAGLGISVLPGLICPDTSHTSVVARPLVRPTLARTLGFSHSGERAPMPAVAAFVTMTVKHLQARTNRLPAGVSPVTPHQETLRFLAQKNQP